ncbi:MAG: sugar phosphate isomerase/epimerase, partial [Saprospiraceae bacterium]|nr:sugar phosphate isomerase/epimerase [Saprospiraceae bacterium]
MKINRRHFLETSALASGGVLIEQTLPKLAFAVPTDFSLTILATNWGFSGTYEEFCAKAKASGYDGVELWLPREADNKKHYSR